MELKEVWIRTLGSGPSIKSAGLGTSTPNLAKWLGDVRSFFPSDNVRKIPVDMLFGIRLGERRIFKSVAYWEQYKENTFLY